MQCAGGLQDGATRCAQLLNMLHDLPTDDQDPDDPVTFINTDIKAAFQEMCRQVSFDTLTGKATQPYDDGRVQPGDVTFLGRHHRHHGGEGPHEPSTCLPWY